MHCEHIKFSFSPAFLTGPLAFLALVSTSAGRDVSLAWNANPEPNVSGYMVHYGPESGNFDSTMDVGSVTQATVVNLPDDVTYYFVVTAYSNGGAESAPSNQVSAQPPPSDEPESYADWIENYFTEKESAANLAAPLEDPDGDGIANLQEFAFNLHPRQPARELITPGTGLGGLPLVQMEHLGPAGRRLTVEFVRRIDGSGVAYQVQFATSLGPGGWQPATATATVEQIDSRWERVRVASAAGPGPLFARVLVSES